MNRYMKKTFIITVICAILIPVVYMQCRTGKPADPRGEAYVGSAACVKCHGGMYNSYLHTAHHVASIPASLQTIHGSFLKGLNEFIISPTQKIVMEKKDSGLYQTYYVNGRIKESKRMDIVFGGVKGETYLYWQGNELYQLPVSYYTKQNKWLISPGYSTDTVRFNRAIGVRCMQCHASFIADVTQDIKQLKYVEQFDKSSLVYSVDCERCHGPGAQHVQFQAENPGIKTAKFITSYSSLPRARRLEMCGVCHSGKPNDMIRSTFGFKPGDTLANFKLADYETSFDTAHLDVHGNQLQLLESSKCFINSKMDCATCHDTHQNQRGNSEAYIQKCLTCHSTVNHNYCKMATTANAQLIRENCIKCHMPQFSSTAITAKTSDKKTPTDILVHTHRIAIYPQEVNKLLSKM